GSGLDAFHPDQGTFIHYPWLDGMTVSQPLNIQEDASGDLWVTMYGPAISRVTRATRRVTRYFAEEGYLEEAIMGAFLRTSKGELLVGGMDGFVHFRPEEIVDRTDLPSVQFTKLSIAGKPTVIDKEVSEGVLDLSHTENYLAFSMVTVDYVNPRRNRLRYQLVGADPAPVEVEGAGTVDYSGLAPGSYTLRITGANSDGYWNHAGLSVPIRIHPPWWQSWYFRLGAVAAIVLLALYLHHVRVQGLLERERFKAKMSAELHDEIGSGLTRIALLSEIAQRKSAESPTQAGDAFQRIAQLARELHEAMGDVVWSINPKHDTMESFIQRATRYLNEVCEARGIVLTLKIGEDVASLHANPEMLRNMLLVTKEAMTNVVRHASCDRSEVHMRRDGSAMTLTVVDNGKGMDLAGSVEGNGLRNMRKRVEQLGGTLTVWSELGKGMELRFVIPTNTRRAMRER
ncbi:MAG: histidine kinase, partial [Bacteroidetes bacterium]|nr:histidine kinase [Bacteroidota bacterium]